MKKRLKVLVLSFVSQPITADLDLEEALETEGWMSEADVVNSLRKLGHEVALVVVHDDIDTLRRSLRATRPDIVFNLADEFRGRSTNDYQIASCLEAFGIPYTGCGPAGLLLAKDKSLAKMILRHHRIKVPDFATFVPGRKIRRPPRLAFPLIVKSLYEEGSVGIAKASIVENDAELEERVSFVHRTFAQPALVEQYIDGREIYAALLGNDRYSVLPLRELRFDGDPDRRYKIASYRVKWDWDYRDRWGITNDFARDLPEGLARRIASMCRRAARALRLDGYARFDLRVTPESQPYLIEANPNPFLAWGEDFAESADAAGYSFEKLLQRILRLGLKRHEELHRPLPERS